MAKRWSPILGITGFDGGSKPSISLAVRRTRQDVAEEIPETPDPCSCCPSATETIDITFAEVGDTGLCTGCVLTAHYAIPSITSLINTAFTLSLYDDETDSCTSYQNLSAGTLSVTIYEAGDCSGTSATISMDLSIQVVCYNPGDGCRWQINAFLQFNGACPPPFPFLCDCSFTVFYCDVPVGDPLVNQCPGVFGNCVSTGGSATIS